ncbi:hypothetical protein GCM10011482_06220 [Enterococcus alcedinis]|uniref:Uncharacterized protein n=1 Tax=Enterococcus alcedinis TaxID=1274384 RepID=A0A917N3W2_9ENTE|nr:hypothetical protein [Enterococcus alcedinis]MBP2101638.1 hypothetical protein [Enterococcus alcedinis]GGI64968.1 hypothetical protein GCM10011482_06220 [Enterococcus alcedinis]
MTIETLQALTNSQGSLIALQQRLSATRDIMKEEVLQNFVFDLRDYADSLRVVTDLSTVTTIETIEVTEISRVFSEQNQLLRTLITDLEELDEQNKSQEFLNLTEGELRRLIGSLQGVLELNSLNLQDNLIFQRQLKDKGITVNQTTEVVVDEQEKTGFFQRLFGKK